MPLVIASAPAEGAGAWRPAPHGEQLLSGYLCALAARGAGNRSFLGAARAFLARWPDPQAWTEQPLPVRLSAGSAVRPLLTYLMLAGYLRPGYDYLLERKLPAILREAHTSPLAGDVTRFLSAATELGYSPQIAAGLASQVAVRMLIQTGRPLSKLGDADTAASTLLHAVLAQEGIDCHVAENGVNTLALAKAKQADAVMVDVSLPGLDGFQVLAELKRDPAMSNTVTILLTARQAEADVLRGFGLGADDYITKPFSPMEVVARLKRFLLRKP